MSRQSNPKRERVAVYCDGFNLYRGIHELAGRRYLWLDLEALARGFLRADQSLEMIRYFTAPVRNNDHALTRQRIYHRALNMHTCVEVVLGRFQEKRGYCASCGATWRSYEEKETDVSIAVSMIEDAVNDRFDVAIILSADSDLCPAIRAIRRLRPQITIIAAFPPRRRSGALRRECDGILHIGETSLRNSQLPYLINGKDGRKCHRPAYWT